MEVIFLISGLLLGVLIGFLILRSKYTALISQIELKDRMLQEKESNITEYVKELELQRNKVTGLIEELAVTRTNNQNLQAKFDEYKKEVEEIQDKLKIQFENLASRILDEKSQKFTELNKQNLDVILSPLKEKITAFENKVNEVYIAETRERSALSEQIRMLHEQGKVLSEEANNLTRALKGDVKAQGTWGELILERILEVSGLTKGREFEVQQAIKDEEGNTLKPDVIVNLPENKHIIIDSKVSLKAYESYIRSEDESERNKFLKLHLESIRNHIKNLSIKNYQNLYGINSLDFVIIFLPVEPAFSVALQHDPSLWEDAFSRNIVLATPATLLATLRTIANMWSQEKRVRNAMEIAKKGGELYDIIVQFTEEMIKVGNQLDNAKNTYSKAMKKLYEGRKNMLSKAEELKIMGVPTSKSIDKRLLDRISEEDTDENNSKTDISPFNPPL